MFSETQQDMYVKYGYLDYARGILRDRYSFTLYTYSDNIYNYSYPYIFFHSIYMW